jgi:hypothetical protein
MTQSTDFAQLDAERKLAGRQINPEIGELTASRPPDRRRSAPDP